MVKTEEVAAVHHTGRMAVMELQDKVIMVATSLAHNTGHLAVVLVQQEPDKVHKWPLPEVWDCNHQFQVLQHIMQVEAAAAKTE
jgi:hypothetical protein